MTRYAVGIPPVRVMRDQLVQVFLNLIQNAMDATLEGGLIEISTSLRDGWICVAIRDDGDGISPSNREKIFAPYFTTKSTGTGLALFVCRHLLDRSGTGRIELTATGEQGTTFSVLVTADNVASLTDIAAPETGVDHSLSTIDGLLP